MISKFVYTDFIFWKQINLNQQKRRFLMDMGRKYKKIASLYFDRSLYARRNKLDSLFFGSVFKYIFCFQELDLA